MLLDGIFLPVLTPFRTEGRLFPSKLEHNVDHYSRTPAAGMLVLGSAGEAESLTDEETRTVLRTAIGAAAKTKVMIASVGRASVYATLLLAEAAAVAGYDVVGVRVPGALLHAGMSLETLTYFRMIADQSPLPVLLVSERERPFPVRMVAELAGHPHVLGAIVEDASEERVGELVAATVAIKREARVTAIFGAVTGRMVLEEKMGAGFVSVESLGGGVAAVAAPARELKTRMKPVGFQLLGGSSAGMLEAWSAGAVGAVPRLGACAPQGCCEVYQAFKDGDVELAREKQMRLAEAGALMEGADGIAGLKYGCDRNGYFGGRPRLPLLPLTAEGRERVEVSLAGLRN